MTAHSKIAVGVAGVERLRREAAVLEAVRQPGVVEMLGFTDEGGVAELHLAEVDGPPLARADHLRDDEVAGLAAAVATTLADLHDAGIVHGSIEPSHVLLGTAGPVLCGFGGAGPPAPGRQPADDVEALARLVLGLVERGPVAEVARSLGSGTARDAAAAFRACVTTATLPGRDVDPLAELLARPKPRRRRPRVLVAALAVVVVAVGLALVPRDDSPRPVVVAHTTTTVAVTTTPASPQATLVWPPTTGPAPTIQLGARRFSAGQPGDVALAGPFGCKGAAAAVLRPATGQVYVFAEAGHDVVSRPVATVVGGEGLRSEDTDSDGCPDLLVERGDAAPVPVALP